MTIKQIEKELNELKAKVSTLAKSRSKQWWIVAGVGLVLIVVLLVTVFRNKGGNANEKIESLQNQIDHLKRSNEVMDSLIKEQDTLYFENRKTETKIIERYERIPSDVKSLDREQLREQITNY